ncbi:MAG: glycosyltransferase family 4 protein [Actinomycetota bacterium]|nr:glycosyltransferase family 4 protein [Actinomycetota bacterium]
MAPRVLSAIMFYPRGGSSHAARALARGLTERGYSVTLLAGSRSDLGPHSDARAFYGSIDVRPVKFDAALRGDDPMRYDEGPGDAPMHPSFEDRPGAPDRVFAALDDLDYERQVRAWSRELQRAGAADADVIHLHHLTPLNEAADRVAPGVPLVGQLHGTELLMLEQIRDGAPPTWTHADQWAGRMRAWARCCTRLVVSPAGVQRAAALLEMPAERFVALPGGVDTDLFAPRAVDRDRFWLQALVTDSNAALPGGPPGSLRYDAAEVASLAAGVVLLYVGRFTAVKRLDRLIGAFAEAQAALERRVGLVLVGGHPGEWEGEHPAELAARLGVRGVFLAGWRAHEELPEFFCASDALVTASRHEQFGQVLVEAMACSLPALAVRSLGPASIVDSGRTGWLVEPDDDAAYSAALREVIEDREERLRRGRAAHRAVCERFSWAVASNQLAAVLEEVLAGTQRAPVPA